jgi:hypothetical protein
LDRRATEGRRAILPLERLVAASFGDGSTRAKLS